MSKALFVFDHKFPCDDDTYFYSSGFDKEFFKRYLEIFDEFVIFGRKKVVNKEETTRLTKVEFPCEFVTFVSNKKLLFSKESKLLKNKVREADYIIARMPSLFGSLAIKYAKKHKKPYIVEVVACTYDALINSSSWKRKVMAKPAEAFYRSVLRNNPYTVYVTEEFLQRKYPCDGKQIACSNVTLLSVDGSVLDRRVSKLPIDPTKRIILGTTSTLGVDFKGQKYVIAGLKSLVDKGYNVEYQMVGDGDGQWLLDLADECHVRDRVSIIGSLPHEKVFDWLDTIDIYVHPSSQEGLSRAIIEAMSRGCPIVACDTGGVHELIDDDFIVKKCDVDDISNGIVRMLGSDMKEQAISNFNNSKKYLKDTLYSRRRAFFKQFMEETSGK